MVQAVCSNHPFWAAWLNISVTTDDVVVADAEVESSLTVPCIDLSGRAKLIGLYCRTMNYYQSNGPHDCTANVVTIVVMIVAVSLRTFATVVHRTLIIRFL